ncbi:MAG: Uma2 family endonuclease [Luteolibacter sp.]|jgi:Uma2 family endonuclease|nr:Uma2 family endonuclease [Luteolibacter sp.]
MTALKQLDSISVADYLAGEEAGDVKHEYLGGTVHAMAGASNRHNTIAGNIFAFLHAALRGKPCRPFNSDTKVRIRYRDHTRFYYPDAMVVCRPNPDDEHFQDEPVVILEILSDSTRRADLVEKRDAYLTLPSMKVLIFVEPDTPDILVYRATPEGGFAIERHTGLESVISLLEIDANLPLAEVYERVDFTS